MNAIICMPLSVGAPFALGGRLEGTVLNVQNQIGQCTQSSLVSTEEKRRATKMDSS